VEQLNLLSGKTKTDIAIAFIREHEPEEGLSEREWICPSCSNVVNRDKNASLNLRDTEKYKVA